MPYLFSYAWNYPEYKIHRRKREIFLLIRIIVVWVCIHKMKRQNSNSSTWSAEVYFLYTVSLNGEVTTQVALIFPQKVIKVLFKYFISSAASRQLLMWETELYQEISICDAKVDPVFIQPFTANLPTEGHAHFYLNQLWFFEQGKFICTVNSKCFTIQ